MGPKSRERSVIVSRILSVVSFSGECTLFGEPRSIRRIFRPSEPARIPIFQNERFENSAGAISENRHRWCRFTIERRSDEIRSEPISGIGLLLEITVLFIAKEYLGLSKPFFRFSDTDGVTLSAIFRYPIDSTTSMATRLMMDCVNSRAIHPRSIGPLDCEI